MDDAVYTVTDVAPARIAGKLRVRLSDGGWFLADAKGEAAAALAEGAVITEAELVRWRAHGGLTAEETAGVILSRRAYSAHELAQKLTQKGFTPTETERALAHLRQLGFVDDEAYAREYIECLQARGKSVRAIREELRFRGIDREIAERLTSEIGDQTALARRLAEQKYGSLQSLSPEERRKAAGWLARRGFDGETVRSALRVEYED